MSPRVLAAGAAVAALAAVVAVIQVRRAALPGGAEAPERARAALRRIDFVPVGDPTVTFEADQPVAWALERSRPGAAGIALGQGEGGAVRWRVAFAGGGEAVITAGGLAWSVSRPVPTDPGPDVFASQAPLRLESLLPGLVVDPLSWRLERLQSWREGGHGWHRARFLGGSGSLPPGWRRELEVELAGATPVGWRRSVRPLGPDVGVVMGRVAELQVLRRPAVLAVVIAIVGVLLAGAEAHAFHERVALLRGAVVVLVVGGLGGVAGVDTRQLAGMVAVSGTAVAMLPVWTSLPKRRLRLGPPLGIATAALVGAWPAIVRAAGGWLPSTGALPADLSPWQLGAESWLPALVEEPLLRGAIPGLAAPVLGWWGGALLGVGAGALLHPMPSVPLVAALAAELALQLGMVVACRAGGVGAAIVARGVYEGLVRRPAFPPGPAWDAVALAPVAVGVILLLWPARKP